jgi:hypothetical protein
MHSEDEGRRLLERPLEYPGLVRRPLATLKVRIWRAPSFDPECSWAVIACRTPGYSPHSAKPKPKCEWFVRRMVYAQPSNRSGVTHDTFGAEGELPETTAAALLRDLRAIVVAPFVEVSGMGIDGARYGIEMGGFSDKTSCLSWWGAAPEEWAPLRDWYAAAIRTLEAHLPPSSLPLQAIHPWVE